VVSKTVADGPVATWNRLGLDTSILIYFVQAHPRYGAWCKSLFQHFEHGQIPAFTSTVSLLEVLVQPYRARDDRLANEFFALISRYPGLVWVPVTPEVADRAAQLRADYRLKTPDAIQVATAIVAGATGFLANDRAVSKVREIECLVLDDLL
jgi:predicted nucleic acid-binding protein